jgi:anaerobic selenocysteine-containing dehydrogenase
MQLLGGPSATFDEFVAGTKTLSKGAPATTLSKVKGGWIVGGYLSAWLPAQVPDVFKGANIRVVQDILPSTLTDTAHVLIPAAAWAEKDGCWENHAGRIQAFSAAIAPPEGARREGDVYYQVLGRPGLYNAEVVRREMGEPFASVKVPTREASEPAFEFVEL